MTVQVAVRLPDELVDFLDERVREGGAPSRAAVVSRALEREMRYWAAVRDAEILQSAGPGDDLDDLVAWSAEQLDVRQGGEHE